MPLLPQTVSWETPGAITVTSFAAQHHSANEDQGEWKPKQDRTRSPADTHDECVMEGEHQFDDCQNREYET
jgi:hypothetical protein